MSEPTEAELREKVWEQMDAFYIADGNDDDYKRAKDAVEALVKRARRDAWEEGYGVGWGDGHRNKAPNERSNPHGE